MKFVLGMPRSGTTFISHLLNLVGPVSIHEHLLSLTGFQILASAKEFSEGRKTAEQIRHLLRCYDLRPEVTIDSNYILVHVLPALLREYPDGSFIHLTRDPRDNIRSCVNQLDLYGDFFEKQKAQEGLIRWFVKQNRPWLYPIVKAIHESSPKINLKDWEQLGQLEKNCIYWTESHKKIIATLSGGKNYLQVRIEDLKKDRKAVLNIFDFFELPRAKEEKLNMLLNQTVNASSEPMWAEFTRIKKENGIPILSPFNERSTADQNILIKHCGETARNLGYYLI